MVVLRSPALPLRDGSGGGGVGVRRIGGRCGDMAAVGKRGGGAFGGERPVPGGAGGGGGEGGGGDGGQVGGDGVGGNERLMRLLRKLWAQTDALFDVTIGPDSMLERPIALRNPFLFCTFFEGQGGGGGSAWMARGVGGVLGEGRSGIGLDVGPHADLLRPVGSSPLPPLYCALF